jgi:hypothetical protein
MNFHFITDVAGADKPAPASAFPGSVTEIESQFQDSKYEQYYYQGDYRSAN